jgi:hypothetical protein
MLLLSFPRLSLEADAMNANYIWMPFYEAAVLETDLTVLPSRIETAQYAIGQRVIKLTIDDEERRAIVRTLNALAALKRDGSKNSNAARRARSGSPR